MIKISIPSIFLLFSLLFISENIQAQESSRPQVAVVLSGGGAKGFAHIGALKVLEEQGIPIDIIVGTSMGSIVGGLYSLGYSATDIELMAKSQNWTHLLTDNVNRRQLSKNMRHSHQRYALSIPTEEQLKPSIPQGAIHGQNILNLFCDLAGEVPVNADFDNFPIRFACTGTDLKTGKEVIIDDGFFPTAIYSSMAIPGVFIPLKHNEHVMLDGGMANNFPADIAKKMGADIIIGVDIRNDLHEIENITSIKEILDQLINFYTIEKDSINKSYCNLIIRPDINGYSASSFTPRAVDTLILRGESATRKMLAEIQSIKQDYRLTDKGLRENYRKSEIWKISDIQLKGNYHLNEKLILDKLSLKIPGSYSYNELKDAIDQVYGLGCFEKVYFYFSHNPDGSKILNLVMEEQRASGFNLGFRLNTMDAVSILLNYSQYDYNQYFGNYSITADISSNPGFNVYGEISKGKWPIVGVELNGKYQDYKLFAGGEKISSTEIFFGESKAFLYQSINKNTIAGLGLSIEFYKGTFFTLVSDSLVKYPDKNTTVSNLYAFYSMDNLDDYYYPTRGNELYSELSAFDNQNYNNINTAALLKFRTVIPLAENLHIMANLNGRALFTDSSPLIKRTFIGGHSYEIYFKNHLPFYGIPPIMPAQQYSFIGLTGLRARLSKDHYISVLGNALFQSDDISSPDNYSIETGYAIDYNYRSQIGPIGFTIAYSPWYKQPVFSANAGLWF